jgi:hypothetical protein
MPKKKSTRELMQQAALLRYTKPGERERTTAAVQKAFKNIDRSGTNNNRFGKPCSEITKQRMRDQITNRGGVAGANNPMFGKPRSQDIKNAIRTKLQKSICHNGHPKEPGKTCRVCARESERRYRERKRPPLRSSC